MSALTIFSTLAFFLGSTTLLYFYTARDDDPSLSYSLDRLCFATFISGASILPFIATAL